MKGIILNFAQDFVKESYSQEKLDEIIANCNFITKEPFVGPGTYPDEDLIELVLKASDTLSLTPNEFLKKFGHFLFFKLAEKYPRFVTSYTHPKEFLKTVEDIIHVEVRKLHEGVYLPSFTYTDPAPDRLIITYHSKRKLYSLMEGLIDGVATYFQSPVQQTHRIYKKDGDEFCDFDLQFSKS